MKSANDEIDPVVPVTIGGERRPGGLSRREAMQWVMGAVAASALPSCNAESRPVAQQETHPVAPPVTEPVGKTPVPQEVAAAQPAPTFEEGYGVDPDLVRFHKPGDLWPLTLDAAQKATATALADVILPADHLGPAASEVGVIGMVDEWVSAPYPQTRADRAVVLEGLAWIDAESQKRNGQPFAALAPEKRQAICEDICGAGDVKPEFRKAAGFFTRFRSLCAAAYYATPAGWKAIGYVGNIALPSFDGPPPEVLAKLGVTQTVA